MRKTVPWVTGSNDRISEIEYAWELAKLPEYRTERGARDTIKIAKELERIYHNGMPVRRESSVSSGLSQYKRTLPPYEALKEEETREFVLAQARAGLEEILKEDWIEAEDNDHPHPHHKFSEEHYMWMLSLCLEYRSHEGLLDSERIAEELNGIFHDGSYVRTSERVMERLSAYKKSLPPHESEKEDLLIERIKEQEENLSYSRDELKKQAILITIDSLAKTGIYERLGIPANYIVKYLSDDPQDRLYGVTYDDICKTLQEGLVLDDRIPLIIEGHSSRRGDMQPLAYSLKWLGGRLLKMSENKRYVQWFPSER